MISNFFYLSHYLTLHAIIPNTVCSHKVTHWIESLMHNRTHVVLFFCFFWSWCILQAVLKQGYLMLALERHYSWSFNYEQREGSENTLFNSHYSVKLRKGHCTVGFISRPSTKPACPHVSWARLDYETPITFLRSMINFHSSLVTSSL